jgi:multidrug resistance efflux pump
VVASASVAQQHIPEAQAHDGAAIVAVTRPSELTPLLASPEPLPAAVVEAPHSFLAISAPVNGIVEVVFVRPGDHVEAGQPLLTFDDRQAPAQVAQLRLELASARGRAAEIDHSLAALDATIAAARAQLPAPPSNEMPAEAVAAVARAEAVYNEAIARERRALALQAHGVTFTQELEAAQLSVRTAAESLALVRREAEAKAALAASRLLDARTEAESAIARHRAEREQLASALAAAREAESETESAIAAAIADTRHLVVRAPATAVVTELAVQAGDRAVAGSPMLTLDRIPPP